MCLYAILLWVCISNCIGKHAHGTRSTYEVSLGIAPGIKNIMNCTFWENVCYYDDEEMFYKIKEKIGFQVEPMKHWGDARTYWILPEN